MSQAWVVYNYCTFTRARCSTGSLSRPPQEASPRHRPLRALPRAVGGRNPLVEEVGGGGVGRGGSGGGARLCAGRAGSHAAVHAAPRAVGGGAAAQGREGNSQAHQAARQEGKE